jgi:PAS domain S-box-containing protein
MPSATHAGAQERAMSLRLRINLLITVLMAAFALALGKIAIDDARSSIHEEIEAGTKVTVQMLSAVVLVGELSGSSRQFILGFLQRLGRVRANDIRVYDATGGPPVYQSPPSRYKEGRFAPAWYAALVAPHIAPTSILLPGARLEIVPEPSRATLDAWDDVVRLLVLGGLFLVLANLLVFWYVSRSLRPIGQIQRALSAMEGGRFDVAIPELRLPELRRIGEAFNRMAGALGEKTAENRRLALALRQSSDAILIHEPDGRIAFWNPAAGRLFGYREHDIMGKSLLMLAPATRRSEVERHLDAIARREAIDTTNTRLVDQEGREIDVSLSAAPVFDPDSNRGGIVILRDLSAQLHAQAMENELRQNRELARVVEAERSVIAQELHDELAQCVTAIGSIAEFIGRRSEAAMPDVRAAAQNVKEIAGRIYDGMHSIVRRLRPTRLDALGLARALEEIVASGAARHPGVECTLAIEGDVDALGEAVNVTIYRLVQEALTNVVRHANATRAVVTIRREDDVVRASIRDDGHGRVDPAAESGFGLAGMRQRIAALGGSLSVDGTPGVGTEVRAVIPLAAH